MSEIDWDFDCQNINNLDVSLKHMYYFVVVADTGNITRAAQRLFVTQPVLSKNIMALEEKMGTPLFYRKDRSLTLTQQGRFFYQQWKKLITGFRVDLERASRMKDISVEIFRVGCFPVLNSNGFLRHYMDNLNMNYPNLPVEVFRMNYNRLFDLLNRQQADLIFTLVEDIPAPGEYYEWQILREIPISVVVSTSHPLADAKEITMNMLRGEKLILNEPDGPLTRKNYYSGLLAEHQLENISVKYVNNDLTAYLEAEYNRGIAVGIRQLYPVHNDRVRILDVTDQTVRVAAVWNKNIDRELREIIHVVLE